MESPPPYSLSAETHSDATRSQSVSRWHPKMSPYRISVIAITVIVGTVKAVFVYRGISMVSTTLEWIVGVVLTLLIFAFDAWESKESYPKCLHQFFAFDCAELVWKTLRVFSITRPRYRSDEFNERLQDLPDVPMTGYRILVSTTVVGIGSVKAVLAYLGKNTTANYLDWTLAVVITSLLYYTGLYESNSLDLAPDFYVRDHYNLFFRVLRDILVLVVLAVCLWGSVKGLESCVSGFTFSFKNFMDATSKESEHFMLVRSLSFFVLIIWAVLVAIAFSNVVFISLSIGWAVLQEPEFFRFLFRRGKFVGYYDFLRDVVKNVTSFILPVLRRFRSPTLRVVIHLVVLAALTNLLFIHLILLMTLLASDLTILRSGSVGYVIGMILVQMFLCGFLVFGLWVLYYIVLSLLSPFVLRVRRGGLV